MLRVMDAPGFYAAFPWGGYARDKGGDTGARSAIFITSIAKLRIKSEKADA